MTPQIEPRRSAQPRPRPLEFDPPVFDYAGPPRMSLPCPGKTHPRNPGGCIWLPVRRRKMRRLVGRIWRCPTCPCRYIALDEPLRWERLLTDREVATIETELGIR